MLGFHLRHEEIAAMLVKRRREVWIAMIGQMLVLNRRLDGHIEAGTRGLPVFAAGSAVRLPILLVESCLCHPTPMLTGVAAVSFPEEVGVYFT